MQELGYDKVLRTLLFFINNNSHLVRLCLHLIQMLLLFMSIRRFLSAAIST